MVVSVVGGASFFNRHVQLIMAYDGSPENAANAKSKPDEIPSDYYNGIYKFTFPNGDVYKGGFCAHRLGYIWREGYGIYKTHDGQMYEGEWKDDKLIEEKNIKVKFNNGDEYRGRLSENKFNGPGTYVLPSKLELNCKFKDNKPTGDLEIEDRKGRMWKGKAGEESTLFLPENIFYKNLNDDHGKGFPKYESRSEESILEEGEEDEEEEELTDRQLEKIIFKKSEKTPNDIDFNSSPWVKRYESFKQRKDKIYEKIKSEKMDELSDREKKWIQKYEKFKKELKERLDKRKKLEETTVDLKLLETFWSKEYREKSRRMKVFKPAAWNPFWDEPSNQDVGVVVSEEAFPQEETMEIVQLD